MKAFVTYDATGRVGAVAIPNPEFGEDLAVEPDAGESVLAVDLADVVEGAADLTFPTADARQLQRLREAVRSIAEDHKVDPATRRLMRKGPPESRPGRSKL